MLLGYAAQYRHSRTPGVKSSGAFWGFSMVPASPVSLKIVHSEKVYTGFAVVISMFRTARPSSNSWLVPEPSSPMTPNASMTVPKGSTSSKLSSPLESAGLLVDTPKSGGKPYTNSNSVALGDITKVLSPLIMKPVKSMVELTSVLSLV